MGSDNPISPRLVIIDGKDKGKVIPLNEGSVILGRSKGDIIIQDARVSRSHIALQVDLKAETVTFTDLKSLNGSFLNGEACESGELKDGDKLQLGNTTFDCQLYTPDEKTAASKFRKPLPTPPAEKQVQHPAIQTPVKTPVEAPVATDSGKEDSIKLESVKPGSMSAARREPSLLPLNENDEFPSEPLISESIHESLHDPVMEPDLQPMAARNFELDEDKKKTLLQTDSEKKKKPKIKRKPLVTLSGAKAVFAKLPKRLRMVLLVSVLLLGLVSYLGDSQSPANVSKKLGPMVDQTKSLLLGGKIREALNTAEKTRDQFPDHSEPYISLAQIYMEMGAVDKAITTLEEAQKHEPAQPLATVMLIRLYLQTRQASPERDEKVQLQLSQLTQYFRSDEAPNKALFEQAAKLFLDFKDLNQKPEDVIILARALQSKIAPQEAIGYKLEAEALVRMRQQPKALEVLERGLKVAPKDLDLLEQTVFICLALRKMDLAFSTLKGWLTYYPSNTKALLVSAYIMLNGNDDNGAEPYVQKILRVAATQGGDVHFAEALNLMGRINYRRKNLEAANQYFKQACDNGYTKACSPPAGIARQTDEATPPAQTQPSP